MDGPVLVAVLGPFRLFAAGRPVPVRTGGKIEALLSRLAARSPDRIARDALLSMLWPETDLSLAGQSLNSLIYSLHKLLGAALGGASPVLHEDGAYGLNGDAGVTVDIGLFHALAAAGDEHARRGHPAAAAHSYARAAALYRGDLCGGEDWRDAIERERLRATFLNLLALLAEYRYAECDYTGSLDVGLRLLALDPCREDAHRQVMRCHARRGQRAQALRQYRLCEAVLRMEFDAAPEPATTALFDQIRLSPESV